jgi:beta-galactosidase
VNLLAEVDRSEIEANDSDLDFITISLVDDEGILKPLADREVSVKVEGPGILLGFGSANPKPERNFFEATQMTFDGKALAVIRPTSSGIIHVTFEAKGCTPKTVQIKVR